MLIALFIQGRTQVFRRLLIYRIEKIDSIQFASNTTAGRRSTTCFLASSMIRRKFVAMGSEIFEFN